METTEIVTHVQDRLSKIGIPHLDQYFGVWAIEEMIFRAAVDRVSRMDLVAHIQHYDPNRTTQPPAQLYGAVAGNPTSYRKGYWLTSDGVAVVSIVGTMMKHFSSLSEGASTVQARQAIRAASRDAEARALLLMIDSPGGTVSGTRDLAEEVRAAAAKKRVVAYGEDMLASAAYWVASQATRLYINASALVGSIGTFAVLEDHSKRAGKLGIEVHIVRAGEFKGAGTRGVAIGPKVLADVQRIVDTLNTQFIEAVASGRRMGAGAVRKLADGRVHVGAAAVALGLADGVRTFDQALAEAGGQAAPEPPRASKKTKERTMTDGMTYEEQAAAEKFIEAVREKSDAGVNRFDALAQVAKAHPDWHVAYLLSTNEVSNHDAIRARRK